MCNYAPTYPGKWVVGRVDGTLNRFFFDSLDEGATWLSKQSENGDPLGVLEGNYYLEPAEEWEE